jgi:saxitoxin biosynthesis operon SxtJ-like protein
MILTGRTNLLLIDGMKMGRRPDAKELRNFGLLVGAIFTVIGFWPTLFRGEPLHLWAFVIGSVLILSGGLVPTWLAPIYRAWMWVGHVLGWINTRILLGIIFYGLITPIGIIFRLLGKDTMRQAFSDTSSTYRVNRQARPASHMKFQF